MTVRSAVCKRLQTNASAWAGVKYRNSAAVCGPCNNIRLFGAVTSRLFKTECVMARGRNVPIALRFVAGGSQRYSEKFPRGQHHSVASVVRSGDARAAATFKATVVVPAPPFAPINVR